MSSAWLSKHRNDVKAKEVTDKYSDLYNKSVVVKQINGNKITDVLVGEDAYSVFLKNQTLMKFEIKQIRLA